MGALFGRRWAARAVGHSEVSRPRRSRRRGAGLRRADARAREHAAGASLDESFYELATLQAGRSAPARYSMRVSTVALAIVGRLEGENRLLRNRVGIADSVRKSWTGRCLRAHSGDLRR